MVRIWVNLGKGLDVCEYHFVCLSSAATCAIMYHAVLVVRKQLDSPSRFRAGVRLQGTPQAGLLTMNKPTILIVDDDREIAALLGEMLLDEPYQVLYAFDGLGALRTFHHEMPDLVVLDIMMPTMDGWETLRRLREVSDVPVIMLSCRTDEADKVRGLDLGADDYITKPVSHLEFVARVRAALRRGGSPVDLEGVVAVDSRLTLDHIQHRVLIDGQPTQLTDTEFRLLRALLVNAGRISTSQSLIAQIWGWEHSRDTARLKVHIHHLRRKIEPDPHDPRYIITERGLGYRFRLSSDA